MAIPDFQTAMRPSLAALDDGAPHSQQQIRDAVAALLGVTDEERQVLIPSGSVPTFSNRVGWALTYLRHAGLVDLKARNSYTITERGRDALARYPDRIDMKVLDQYPEFQAFRARSAKKKPAEPVAPVESAEERTPNDAIEAIVAEAEAALAADLLERVYAKPPKFLERLALRLLQSMGYGGKEALLEHTGGSGDRGLDGVIRQDSLGLDRIGVQAKRYDPEGAPVPGKEVQAFVGALDEVTATRGVFVTTGTFSKAATSYAGRASKRVVLIDGAELTRLMLRYGVGVQEQQRFVLLEPDDDFFED